MKFKSLSLSVIIAVASPALVHASASDKHLPSCGNAPNCVSSKAEIRDKQHFILPFEIKTKPEQAWEALKMAIIKQPRMIITHETPTTLHAEATSLMFQFVDDINVMLDKESELIHIRSTSRVGHGDFGVTRRRLEALREQLRKAGVVD